MNGGWKNREGKGGGISRRGACIRFHPCVFTDRWESDGRWLAGRSAGSEMTRGVEEVGGWVVEEGDPRGESIGARRTMATVSMERERERGREKIFEERWRGDSIRFRGKKKEKRKTRDDTSPRKSIFSK